MTVKNTTSAPQAHKADREHPRAAWCAPALGALLLGAALPALAGSAQTATVPMALALSRPYIDLKLTGPSGTQVTAHAWLDTGGGGFLLSAHLAQRLGLKAALPPSREEGELVAPTTMPAIAIGDLTIRPEGVNAIIMEEQPDRLMRSDAQAGVPVRMLRGYHIVLDYPAHTFTVALPGALAPRGAKVETFVGESGMPVVAATVDGVTQQYLLDTGGTYTMVSQKVQDRWAAAHGDWTRVPGAYGPANMLAGNEPALSMLVLASLEIGGSSLRAVGTITRPAATYEDWMARDAGAPIVGSLGGNVLSAFRVDIDYPGRQVYLAAGDALLRPRHIDMVPVIIGATDSGYFIAAADPRAGPLLQGDVLVSVDGRKADGTTLPALIAALSGRPGEHRTLVVRRGGTAAAPLTVSAAVVRIL